MIPWFFLFLFIWYMYVMRITQEPSPTYPLEIRWEKVGVLGYLQVPLMKNSVNVGKQKSVSVLM